jgi:hypothetical protein
MKALGSAILAILVGLVALWVMVKLVFFTLKLVGVVIAVGIALVVFVVVKNMVLKGSRA